MNPFKYGCTVGGKSFCPRPELERRLAELVLSGQNVVIQGERRMGKTSLVLETVRHLKGFALFHADFLCVRDQADICRRILTAIARLESSEGWFAKMLKAFAYLRPLVSIDPVSGAPTLSLDARLASEPSTLEAILDTLLAQTSRRKVCAVFDEFQDILDVEDGERILAVMRARIQLDSGTSYVFLGSVRNKMTDIFWHPDSPFYHSAASFPVGEIAPDDFFKFVQSRFATGKRTITRNDFDAILRMARATPGYVQELCGSAWDETEVGDAVDETVVNRALQAVFAREQEHFEVFVRRLTPLQARVLKSLAMLGGREVFSAQFLASSSTFNASSVKGAIRRIEKEGIIYCLNGEYKFVNPFFGEWVKRT